MIAYASRTGNVKNIVDRLNIDSYKIERGLVMDKPFILATYTDNLGDVPIGVLEFLKYNSNYKNLRGVFASGNKNFGEHFCASATKISEWYKVPTIRMVDLRGDSSDIKEIEKQIDIIIKGADK